MVGNFWFVRFDYKVWIAIFNLYGLVFKVFCEAWLVSFILKFNFFNVLARIWFLSFICQVDFEGIGLWGLAFKVWFFNFGFQVLFARFSLQGLVCKVWFPLFGFQGLRSLRILCRNWITGNALTPVIYWGRVCYQHGNASN